MKILFSPIGKTDPIANFRDGSMLHLCRVEKPDVVYLYITNNFLPYHEKDNRYHKAILKLGEHLDHKFDVKIIARENVISAHRIEGFFEDFETIFEEIFREYGSGSTLIVNSTQGTPVMKSALMTISAMSNHNILLKQVSNAEGGVNQYIEDLGDYDLEEYWALDLDNQEADTDRTFDVEISSFNKRVQKEVISKQIASYDYHAAWTVAQMIADVLHPEVLTLLEIAVERTRLNKRGYLTALNCTSYTDIIPYKNDEQILLYEYALWLRMKQQRGDHLDFIRGLSPMMFSLCIYALKKINGIDVYTYCTRRNNIWYLSPDKIRTASDGAGLLTYLDDSFGGTFRPHFLSEIQMLRILEYHDKGEQSPIIRDLQDLRSVEENVRNHAAHQIVFLDDNEIKRRTGYTSSDILQLIKKIIKALGMKVSDDGYWNSYDDLNQKIDQLLRI